MCAVSRNPSGQNKNLKKMGFGRYGPFQPKSALPKPIYHYFTNIDIWTIERFCERSDKSDWLRWCNYPLVIFSSVITSTKTGIRHNTTKDGFRSDNISDLAFAPSNEQNVRLSANVFCQGSLYWILLILGPRGPLNSAFVACLFSSSKKIFSFFFVHLFLLQHNIFLPLYCRQAE